jgi:hypothetical protein
MAADCCRHILYCLWLVPCKKQADEISKTISKLASRNNLPFFTPHITLASAQSDSGELEAEAKIWFQSVSERLNFDVDNRLIKFGPPRTGDTRHQCVFVEVLQNGGYEILSR